MSLLQIRSSRLSKPGARHSKSIDKFKEYNIATESADAVVSPVIKGFFASIEWKVITSFPAGKFTVYVAEASNLIADDKASPLVWYLNRYYALGEGKQ